MAFCRVVFPLLVLSVISCYASNVPVIIWGNLHGTSIKADPLSVISEKQFQTIVSKLLVDQVVTVVFVEETLSVEDCSRKEFDGDTSFPYLQGIIHEAIYLPNVKDPLLALKSLENGEETSIVLTENGLTEDLPAKVPNVKFVIINLKDAGEDESRPEFLRRHDKFMQDTMLEMQKRYGDIVAIYTAENPSWIITQPAHLRVRRDTTGVAPYELGNLRLSAKAIIVKSMNNSITLSHTTNFQSENNITTLNVTMVFENNVNITLNFNTKAGYWFFNSVILTNASDVQELLPVGDEVFAIEGFSYRCAQQVKFSTADVNYAITFENLKIQPFFEAINSTEDTPQFGDSFNCVGFFTAPIWAGLFVVFILLAITFYGIMMMMDIRTMDRFDDPKGKTITINAGE